MRPQPRSTAIAAPPAAPARNRGEPRHETLADALTARLFRDVEVFEIEARPAEPGRETGVGQRASRRLAIEKGEDRLELRVRAKAVAQEIGLGRDDCARRAFEYRELPDEAQHERHILRGREADGDV